MNGQKIAQYGRSRRDLHKKSAIPAQGRLGFDEIISSMAWLRREGDAGELWRICQQFTPELQAELKNACRRFDEGRPS